MPNPFRAHRTPRDVCCQAQVDVVSRDEGDDRVNVLDGNADVARGGDGNDSVAADRKGVDLLEGFESVQLAKAPKVAIKGGTIKVSKGRAAIRVERRFAAPHAGALGAVPSGS
jgi:hypothetical protein